MFLRLSSAGLPKVVLFIILASFMSRLWGPVKARAADPDSSRKQMIAAGLGLTQGTITMKTLDKAAPIHLLVALQVTTTVTATMTATATGSVTPSPTVTGTAMSTVTPQPTNSPTATDTPNSGTPTPTMPSTDTAVTSTPSVALTATATVTQTQGPITTPVPAPGILAFDAKPSQVNAGASTVLSWRLVNAETALLRASNDEETLSTSGDKIEGSKIITPTADTLYTLVARSRGGEASRQLTITVNTLGVTPPLTTSSTLRSFGDVTPTQTITIPNAAPQIVLMTPSPTPGLQVIIPASPLLTATTTLTPLRSILTLPVTPVDLDPQSPPPDPAQTQQLLLFGVLAAALMVPFGIASLALLIWVIGRQL